MSWLDISIFLSFFLKIEAGVAASRLAGNSELYTIIIANLFSLIGLFLKFGAVELFAPSLKSFFKRFKKLWEVTVFMKVKNFFRINTNHNESIRKKILKFLEKRHFIFYLILSAIPFAPWFTEICIVSAAKLTKYSTLKGYAYIMVGHLINVTLTVIIIYRCF